MGHLNKKKGKKASIISQSEITLKGKSELIRSILHSFIKEGIKIQYHKKIYGLIVDDSFEDSEKLDVIGFFSEPLKLENGEFFPHPDDNNNNYYEVIEAPDIGMIEPSLETISLTEVMKRLGLEDKYFYVSRLQELVDAGIVTVDEDLTILYVARYSEEDINNGLMRGHDE